jgi:hypothetical protein
MTLCKALFFVLIAFSSVSAKAHAELQFASEELAFNSFPKDGDKTIALANLEGEPSANIYDCVNAITGDFFDFETDLVIPHGVDPIILSRSYCGSACTDGGLSLGWKFQHPASFSYKTVKGKYYFDRKLRASLFQSNGGLLAFEKTVVEGYSYPLPDIHLKSDTLHEGVTNTSRGAIGGITNIKNYRIAIQSKENAILYSGGGEKHFFKRLHSCDSMFQIDREVKSNGNQLQFGYQRRHHQNSMKKITLLNSVHKTICSLTFPEIKSKKMKDDLSWTLPAGDGRYVRYDYMSYNRKFFFLTGATRPNAPEVHYAYDMEDAAKDGEWFPLCRIKRKALPDQRYVNIQYYKLGHNPVNVGDMHLQCPDDPRIGRVRYLLAPAGHDDTPIPIYHFIYDLFVDWNHKSEEYAKPQHGTCDVYNALNHRTTYSFDASHRLSSVLKYDENHKSVARESLIWASNDSSDKTNLLARTLSQERSHCIFARVYKYDARGNAIEQSIYGDLSGHNRTPPNIRPDGQAEQNGCECYTKYCTYSNDGFNLLLEEKDDESVTAYRYQPGSNKLIAKLEGKQAGWMRRTFYTYNDEAALIKEIKDDGCTDSPEDLSNVTERRIIYYTQRQTHPAAFPEIIEERCLDRTSGQELLIRKVVNTYDNLGQVEKQDHFDNLGKYAYSLHWKYDVLGNVKEQTDAMDRKTIRDFDSNGNCIF